MKNLMLNVGRLLLLAIGILMAVNGYASDVAKTDKPYLRLQG